MVVAVICLAWIALSLPLGLLLGLALRRADASDRRRARADALPAPRSPAVLR